MSVILHMTIESVVGLMTKSDVYAVAPYLQAMEAPCKRLAAQLKKVGCRSCRSKRVKVETQKAFQKVTDALYDLLIKAVHSGQDLKPLQVFLSRASKNQAIGIELECSEGRQRILFGD